MASRRRGQEKNQGNALTGGEDKVLKCICVENVAEKLSHIKAMKGPLNFAISDVTC
jgi:hypothetical protein